MHRVWSHFEYNMQQLKLDSFYLQCISDILVLTCFYVEGNTPKGLSIVLSCFSNSLSLSLQSQQLYLYPG